MSAFRGYRTKIKKSETSGSGTSSVYQPTWFAYEFMNSFLGTIYKCNPSKNTEDNHDQQDAENINTSQDYTDAINTVSKSEASNSEVERPSRTSYGSSMDQASSSQQHYYIFLYLRTSIIKK
ncbi:hypothetical protein NQ318_005036 [Aromia moschata]|uniref:Uncharacterized protein n=1 Tax=Aromia moschata TaxID=1265417 RepID=A0AAV8YB33_9CUCU|nr:hypothetical protein NQ318_005036 [Aromia moschata]